MKGYIFVPRRHTFNSVSFFFPFVQILKEKLNSFDLFEREAIILFVELILYDFIML